MFVLFIGLFSVSRTVSGTGIVNAQKIFVERMNDSKMNTFDRKIEESKDHYGMCSTEHFKGLDERLKYYYKQRYAIKIV